MKTSESKHNKDLPKFSYSQDKDKAIEYKGKKMKFRQFIASQARDIIDIKDGALYMQERSKLIELYNEGGIEKIHEYVVSCYADEIKVTYDEIQKEETELQKEETSVHQSKE